VQVMDVTPLGNQFLHAPEMTAKCSRKKVFTQIARLDVLL
jgi:hypothetical protein